MTENERSVVQVRLTACELKRVQAVAAHDELTVSDFVRRLIFEALAARETISEGGASRGSEADETSSTDDKTWHGLPKKRYGETYGQYLRRITAEQEAGISRSARFIGVLPRSIFDSYIPYEPDDSTGEETGA